MNEFKSRDQAKSEIVGDFSIPAVIAELTAEITRLKITTASLKDEIKELKADKDRKQKRQEEYCEDLKGYKEMQKQEKEQHSYTFEKDAHFQRQDKHTRLQHESAFQDFHHKKI